MNPSQPLHFHPVIFRNLQAHFKNEPPPQFFSGTWDEFRKIYASSAIFPYGATDPGANFKPARLYVVVTQVQDGVFKRLLTPMSLPTNKPIVQSLMQTTLFNYMVVTGMIDFLKEQELDFAIPTGRQSFMSMFPSLAPINSFIGVNFGETIDLYFQLNMSTEMVLLHKQEVTPGVCWQEVTPQESLPWTRHLKSDQSPHFLAGTPQEAGKLYVQHFLPKGQRAVNQMRIPGTGN